MPLIHSIAGRLCVPVRSQFRDDFIQAGVVGLIRAISGFRSDAGVRFCTYAFPWILGGMQSTFRMAVDPTGGYAQRRRLIAAQERLEAQLDRTPTMEELARACGLLPEEAGAILTMKETLPLTDEVCEGGFRMEERIALKLALETLDKEARTLVLLRYFRGMTQMETARLMGKSQAQISRMERRALDWLKGALS